ncbi:MAG TPA: hypothetical protein VGH29_11060 [Candidatus Binataceae bacterium]
MKLPIKLNEAGWPSPFARLTFAFHDPRPLASPDFSELSPLEFSRAISTLQFGVTFKTTRPGRQGHSNRHISELYSGLKPVVLDVGASDGSTSLDLIGSLKSDFERYFVTDLNLSTRCGYDKAGVLYFLDHGGNCVLRASKRFLAYSEVNGARFPLPLIAKAMVAGHRKVTDWREVLLVQPELVRLAARDPRITVTRYDLFAPWTGQAPDLIKVANLLNGKYFSDAQMEEALRIQCSNLAPNGRLLLVSEDNDIEKFSVFRKSATGMVLEHTHGGGAKASHLVPLVFDLALGLNGHFGHEVRA